MCGLISMALGGHQTWNKAKKYADFLKSGLIMSSLRGMDSTGLFATPANEKTHNPFQLKAVVPPWLFTDMAQVQTLLNNIEHYKFYIGHARAATIGRPSFWNAHPFSHGTITMAHNGTLKGTSNLGVADHFGTDSEYICKALSETDDYKSVLSKINGAFALLWFDSKTNRAYMSRNKERDLHFALVKNEPIILMMSEWKMLEANAWRHDIDIEDVFSVKENTVISFDPNNPRDYKIEEFEGFKQPVVEHKSNVVQQALWNKKQRDKKLKESHLIILDREEIRKRWQSLPDLGKPFAFVPRTLFLPRKKSRSGVCVGTLTSSPHWTVRCNNVDERKIFNCSTVLEGEFVGILQTAEPSPIILLKNARETKVEKPSWAKFQPQRIVQEDGKTLVDTNTGEVNPTAANQEVSFRDLEGPDLCDVPAVESSKRVLPDYLTEDDLAGTEAGSNLLREIPHPNGRDRLTLMEFLRDYGQHGCGACTADLWHDAQAWPEKIKYVDNMPLCVECSALRYPTNH